MRFTKDTIRNLDEEEFTAADKRYLLKKFFPETPLAPWQENLRVEWNSAKRWGRYLQEPTQPNPEASYRHSHASILGRAKSRTHRPKSKNRVTDFTGWIYRLYLPRPSNATLDTGKTVEREIAKNFGKPPVKSGWALIFEDPLNGEVDPFRISSLTVGGNPSWGIPDLVFKEQATNRILIVERKASNAELPSDGWPNLRAQLWAYGQIDIWVDAPEIILVGEIWGFGVSGLRVRCAYVWKLQDQRFFRQNQELFDAYVALPEFDHDR